MTSYHERRHCKSTHVPAIVPRVWRQVSGLACVLSYTGASEGRAYLPQDSNSISTKLVDPEAHWLARQEGQYANDIVSDPMIILPLQIPDAERQVYSVDDCSVHNAEPASQTTCTAWASSPCAHRTRTSTCQSALRRCIQCLAHSMSQVCNVGTRPRPRRSTSWRHYAARGNPKGGKATTRRSEFMNACHRS